MKSVDDLRIGTSGWSYPAGRGTWNGVFYPARAGTSRRGRFDDLAYYAEHFNTVEVNSTFYGPPRPSVSASWVRRTPADFEFSIKLHQKFTHAKEVSGSQGRKVDASITRVEGAKGRRVAGSDREAQGSQGRKAAGSVSEIPSAGPADVDEFRSGLEPIARAGKFGALLVQFPPSFKNGPATLDYLTRVLGWFKDYPVAVELRHRSWSDDVASTLTLLNEHRAAWVQIDEPKFNFSIRQNYLPNVKGFYYMRLHGRNVEKWWRHDRAEDRYDYLYSADELKPFSETAVAARMLVKKLYLYLNNHFASKSVANALMIKHQVGDPIVGEYPASLVSRYPELRPFVPISQPALSPISS